MRILIIGDTSEEHHLGATFMRASREIGVGADIIDISFSGYAPSMDTLGGKIFFRLSKKRPAEWWSLNRKIAARIKNSKPQLILATGIIPLADQVFEVARELKIPFLNYLTDSPWSPQNWSELFQRDLKHYTLVASTKKQLIPRLRDAGVTDARFLSFGFEPTLHRPPLRSARTACDVTTPGATLVGGADHERVQFVLNFLKLYKGNLDIYGSYWERYEETKSFSRGVVKAEALGEVLGSTGINLGIVRRANLDGHSMRSFEIPACGGLGIYEDTEEHREIFAGYPEEGFFRSPEDLALKCNRLLAHPSKREEMREMGMRLVRHEGNTYAARLRTMIDWASS